jgi:hypothetical protein
MLFQYEEILFFGPFLSHNLWVKHVVPSFTALTTKSARDVSLNDHPVLSAVLLNLLPQNIIFLLRPLIAFRWLILRFGIAFIVTLAIQSEPSFEASDLSFVRHESA